MLIAGLNETNSSIDLFPVSVLAVTLEVDLGLVLVARIVEAGLFSLVLQEMLCLFEKVEGLVLRSNLLVFLLLGVTDPVLVLVEVQVLVFIMVETVVLVGVLEVLLISDKVKWLVPVLIEVDVLGLLDTLKVVCTVRMLELFIEQVGAVVLLETLKVVDNVEVVGVLNLIFE